MYKKKGVSHINDTPFFIVTESFRSHKYQLIIVLLITTKNATMSIPKNTIRPISKYTKLVNIALRDAPAQVLVS